MATVTFEAAYQAKKGTSAALAGSLNDVNTISQAPAAANATLSDNQKADDAAEAVLENVAKDIPNDTAVQTSDGVLHVVFGGVIHDLKVVTSDTISYDDGTSDSGTGTDTSGGTGTDTTGGTGTGTGTGTDTSGGSTPSAPLADTTGGEAPAAPTPVVQAPFFGG